MPALRFEMEQDIGPNPLRKYRSSGHQDKTASQLNAIVAIGFLPPRGNRAKYERMQQNRRRPELRAAVVGQRRSGSGGNVAPCRGW